MDLNIWYMITLFGEAIIWFVVIVLLGIIYLFLRRVEHYKNKKMKIYKTFLVIVILSLTIGYFAVTGIKEVTAIPRPCIPCDPRVDLLPGDTCNTHCPLDDSFPSGHTTIAFVLVTSVILASKKKWTIFLYMFAVLVGLSRVMLGVHYMGDVIAGASLGVGITIVAWRLTKNRLKR